MAVFRFQDLRIRVYSLENFMTSAEIRQSFLDFFREKQHTIVPSSSLLPDAPNLRSKRSWTRIKNNRAPWLLVRRKSDRVEHDLALAVGVRSDLNIFAAAPERL